MECKHIAALLCLLGNAPCIAQDLVQNGGFEQYTFLPNYGGQYNRCVGWGNAGSSMGTPDYLHLQGSGQVQLPNSIFGTVAPYAGSAVMGVTMIHTPGTNFREYISTQLSAPMVIGNTYNISLQLTNGAANQFVGYGCDHIGIRLSTAPLHQLGDAPLGLVPQLEIPGVFWSSSWQPISFSFTADSAYQYFTLGNFHDDASTSVELHVNTGVVGAYCFVDQVAVTPGHMQIAGPSGICLGDAVTLSVNNGMAHAWATTADPASILSTDPVLHVAPSQTTTYLAYGSSDTASFTVSVYPPPAISLGNDVFLCAGDSLVLDVHSANATYLWQDGSTDAVYNVFAPGTYWVEVSNGNCTIRDSLTVGYGDCQVEIEFPNVITPNGDGVNDLFRPVVNRGITNMSTVIYNRWGNMVFETSDPGVNWKANGVAGGTYFWLVHYTDRLGGTAAQAGVVTVLR
ncbi:MAG: gliding motility-associated C-terminal domain-containing protein [Bacteroidetes bacterium]|nr:gliding motility-associated C-terminal domain-containing protein [Bacteroidota bacterium]